MDIGEGGMRSSEENEFNGFQLLNSQGRWLRTPPVKPVPGRWQTANGDGEFQWLNSLGLSPALYTPQVSLHNAADLTEASRSGSAMTSRGNQIGDLNFSTDLYGNDSAAAGGFRSNCHGGSVPSCFTEDLASVCTQITSDSLHHTVPKTTHSQNDVGWPHREAQNPIPFTHPSIMGNWSWPQSHLATMSHMTQNSSPNSYNNLAYGINIPSQNSYNNFVYGINTPSQSLSTSDKVAPLTPEKDSWRGVDICSSTCIDPSLTRQLLIDVASNVKQQTGVIQQHDLPHFEQQVQTGQLYNGYYAAQASTYEFPDSYGKVVYGIKPTSTDAATFGTNSTVDTNAIFIPITPEKLANTGTRCSRSSIVNLPMPWELQGDHGSQKETHQPDEVVSKVISDTSLLEPSIIQDNGLKHLTDPQQNQTVSLIKERNGGLEKVSDDGVDLNKTPSQKPKRRKIRPKVVREDKPKRPSNKEQVPQTPGEIPAERKKRPYRRKTHESPTTDAADPVDAPSERKKRPYVRKTKETPTSGTADLETNAISPNATGIATCKRSLIFDFDAQARQYDCSSYLQPNPHKPIPDNQDGAAAVNTIGCATFDLNRPNNNVSFPEIFGASLVQRKDSTQRSSEDRARNNNGLGKVGEKHQEGLSTESGIRILQSTTGSSAVLPNTAGKDEKTVPPQCQSITTQTSTMYALNMLTNQHGPTGPTISPNLTMDMFQQHTRDMILLRISESCGQSLEGLQKRIKEGTQRPDDPCHKVPKDQTPEKQPEELQSCKEYTSTSSAVSSVHQSVNPNKSNSKSFTEASVMYSSREGKAVDVMQHKCANHKDQLDVDQQYTQMNSNAAEKLSAFQHVQEHNCMSAQMEDMRNRRSSIYPNQIYRPFTLFPATGHSSMTQQCVQESFNDHVTQLSHAALPTGRAHPKEPKKRGRKQNPEKNASSNAPALLKSNLQANLNINFLPKAMNPIDEIIYNLKKLDIGSKTDEHAIVAVENAIVPYVAEGTIIPYEPRRRRPRPKVDLDDETTRVWKLLMGSSWEGIDGSDADKEKWWEEERRVFRGRADSFIARMHLVQGDRRFSQWKGSVVDSVAGVFLTQNVSDHLSSSAFMALAARFALKEKAECASLGNNESRISAVTDQVSPARNLHEATQCTKSPSIMKVVPTSLDSEHSEHKESILPQKISTAESYGNEIQESASSTSNLQAASEEVAKLMEPEDGNSVCFSVISSQDSTDSNAQATDQTGSTAEFSITAEEPIGRGTYRNLLQGSFSELLRVAGTPALFKDLCAKENLYLSLGQKIRTTSDLLLHGNWDPNVNKVSEADSSFEIGNKGNTKDMTTNFSAEGSSHTTAFSLENHATSFLNKATDSQFDSFQRGNQTKQQANFHSHTEVKDVNVNTLEHAGSIENQESVESKLGVSKVKSDGKPRQKVFRAKKGDSLSTKEKWDPLRREAMEKVGIRERCPDKKDSLDWEAVRHANVDEIADTIKERGMNHMLAARIQEFLNRLVEDHGSIDLEWLRDVPPDKAKDFLLSINGLGLKSVECVRLLTLHHLAFPVDTNVGRICVRLGWVPLQPLPESLQLHLLELYPVLESIQKYLWPRLCKLDQRTLYELHYQLITFGKVFCTKSRPNCNACPMRGECRHFASAFASARFALPGPEEKSLVSSTGPFMSEQESQENFIHPIQLSPPKELLPAVEYPTNQKNCNLSECEPIIEEPKTPEAEPEYVESSESAIEDFNYEDPDEIPTIKLNLEELTVQVQNYIKDNNMVLQDPDMSKALVALTPEAASIPTPKLKNVSRLRTEHQVYELPDNHPLLDGLDKREPDDPCTYLLAIWTPGETAESVEPPKACCDFEASGNLCDRETCFSCNAIRETNAQTVRGTLLIPCRTAMRGSFPLNGTYFQVNEVFADHESSLNPIAVSRALIWNLPRRTVYFGTSVTSIFKGLTTEGIQYCFWRGFVCVRGFDQKKRAPRPLMARLHFPASKQTRDKRKVAIGLDE